MRKHARVLALVVSAVVVALGVVSVPAASAAAPWTGSISITAASTMLDNNAPPTQLTVSTSIPL